MTFSKAGEAHSVSLNLLLRNHIIKGKGFRNYLPFVGILTEQNDPMPGIATYEWDILKIKLKK